MVPRRGVGIDLTPREQPLGLIGVGGAMLAMWVGAAPLVVLPLAFLVSVRVRLRRI
ncbi:hypothetical protein [Streptomyces sp. 3213.3]|uniref:hypothetical protein n=1 Tax=Streptomyces sp. 3213.3 TaxID=1855348 RepID=UPI00190EA09F|nr:hypothetical protein [Streptomyces sp. 3213.3]